MNIEREWIVLLIGGASGTGKSSVAYELARYFHVNVLEVDDIYAPIKAMTTNESFPSIHYWSSGKNWLDIGVSGNLKWLIDVSEEMKTGLKAIVDRHIEDNLPVIIEGDFISPEFGASFQNPKVKSLFIHEPETSQILKNYFDREGGEFQHFRAEISSQYGNWLINECANLGIPVVESRPWESALQRVLKCI